MLFSIQVYFILLALVVSYMMLVYPGVDRLPNWIIYLAFPIAALGGGAAINLILFGVPK